MHFSLSPFIIQFTDTIGIRWYSLMYLLGLAITYLWLTRVSKYDKTTTSDFVFYGLISAIIGARLGFILFYEPQLIFSPLRAIAVWNGGMSFHGGLLALLFFAYSFAKRQRRKWKEDAGHRASSDDSGQWDPPPVPYTVTGKGARGRIGVSTPTKTSWLTLQLFDDLAAPAALFLTFGRIGNFLNNELWGTITTVPWCFYTNTLEGCHHPSQLYEALYNLVLFMILLLIKNPHPFKATIPSNDGKGVPRKPVPSEAEGSRGGWSGWTKKQGVPSALFLIWYGFFRSLTELLWREPTWVWHGITAGQFLSVPMIFIGIGLLFYSIKTKADDCETQKTMI